MMKHYIQKKLERFVRDYFKKHKEIKLIVITGSVGKTSTKIAIASLLSEKFRVRVHGGNHNSELSAPLAILGITFPDNIRSLRAWMDVFKQAKKIVNEPANVDVIVQELGTDRIGQIAEFGKYLNPDIAVVTSVAPEHMEFFINMDNVAKEELCVVNYSKTALINCDDVSIDYLKYITNPSVTYYGTNESANYRFISQSYNFKDGYKGTYSAPEFPEKFDAAIKLIGDHTIRSAIAAGAIGAKLGMTQEEIVSGLLRVKTVPGRMNILYGAENTILIDDTYNSSPLAAASAIDTLYRLIVPGRIVVLGSMNELGAMSVDAHKKLGELCDPTKLEWVVTVGDEAEKYLAPAAKARGCQVKVCKNALEAGAFVRSVLKPKMVILFKGSQGGIYLEEAVKVVLYRTSDEMQLVRQSADWIKTKNAFFSKFK